MVKTEDVLKALKALPATPPKFRVKTALELRRMTQRDLADDMQLNESLFSNMLAGRRPLLDWQKTRVAELLDLPRNVLFPAA